MSEKKMLECEITTLSPKHKLNLNQSTIMKRYEILDVSNSFLKSLELSDKKTQVAMNQMQKMF